MAEIGDRIFINIILINLICINIISINLIFINLIFINLIFLIWLHTKQKYVWRVSCIRNALYVSKATCLIQASFVLGAFRFEESLR